MSELVFLKLGGALITDKQGDRVFHSLRVRDLGSEILEAARRKGMRLLIAHGGGCFGHAPARRYRVREGLAGGGGWEGYAHTRREVIELNGLVLDALAEAGLFPVTVQPSATAVARDGAIVRMDTAVIEAALARGQTPMIFGDAALDESRGFTIISAEGFMAWLAHRLRPARVIMACDVDGVYDANPAENPDARRLASVDGSNEEAVMAALGGSAGVDVTGGMAGKVRALRALANALPDVEIRIVGGTIPGRVRAALCGEGGGTLIGA